MSSRLYFCRTSRPDRAHWLVGITVAACLLGGAQSASAGAPDWMQALVNVPLPEHDDKTDAIRLYSEKILVVDSNGKIKTIEREAYKILRPDGDFYGVVKIPFDSETKITHLKAWCIPAQGKDYEVKESSSFETALYGVDGSDLITDLRTKVLQIPDAVPGNIVGYEIEHDDRPYVLQDEWQFQSEVPTREAYFTLQLPPGWEYKALWMNHPELEPVAANNQWQWEVSNVKAIKYEAAMPPWTGIAGQLIVSLFPPGGGKKGFQSWSELGSWYWDLAKGRRDPSPGIEQEVAILTAPAATPLAKMQALARFVQEEVRYVAIELAIGGHQPHPAADVFTNRYGDCKDKATLLSSMLKVAGIDSYYVVINTQRGAVALGTPAHLGFSNHFVLAVQLPPGLTDPSLMAVMQHPKLGRILFFDPTDNLTPFGQLRGALQGNYGLLVMPDGGELVELPQLPTAANAINRSAKLTLDSQGTLQGEVTEVRVGDQALLQRWVLRSANKAADQIKPIETTLAHSLATFQIAKAAALGLHETALPFEYDYSFIAPNYAKHAGDLLLVRPRVLGSKSSAILETSEARQYPVELPGPERDTDVFEITLPAGYEVDDLPLPVDANYDFADYHSKAEKDGNVLRYTRVFEVKQLSVPLNQMDDLKKFYRIIATDERSSAVLKPAGH
jgi:Domain of Unknown Function with PDB structure (DUF3857)/Transglutaminase-like superfamily